MKLLFDQNISFRIIKKVNDFLPFASQVRLLGLENAKDFEIWEYAKVNDYTIITFDTDFFDMSILKGTPPKVIWLRLGNTTTDNLVACLKKNLDLIKEFIENTDYKEIACLEIDE
jgi:predicted nuclease of predicted toxin-antitoxin system